MDIIKTVKTTAKAAGKVAGSPVLTGAVLGTGVFIADQLFKGSVELQPEGTFPHDIGKDGILSGAEFKKLHNRGIAMSAFDSDPEKAEKLAFLGAGTAAASLLTRAKDDSLGKVADLMVLGGAASNLYDRKARGYVVDYVHVKKGPLSRIVFNLGDAAIAVGAVLGTAARLGRK